MSVTRRGLFGQILGLLAVAPIAAAAKEIPNGKPTTCCDCRYWSDKTYEPPDENASPPRYEAIPGECRRTPPTFHYSGWAQTYPDEWCGEWQA